MTPNTDSSHTHISKVGGTHCLECGQPLPATDTRELDLVIRSGLTPNYYSKISDKVIDNLEQAIERYTANKQRELLEWVEQELPQRRSTPIGKPTAFNDGFNVGVGAARRIIKNKKDAIMADKQDTDVAIQPKDTKSFTQAWRKKPVIIEAVQWNYGPGDIELRNFLQEWIGEAFLTDGEYWYPGIKTLEGVMRVNPSDYIIRGVAGEFYACKPDIFLQTYEQVSDLPSEGSNANPDAANAPSQEGIGKKQ